MNTGKRTSPSLQLDWIKSGHSGGEGGNCVEVAAAPAAVHVRDSKDRQGPQLAFAPAAWSAFVAFAAEFAADGDRSPGSGRPGRSGA
ncbi:DUF397 domain-containing protein [Streptomyces meridianus]|uniref:DUF397 domain-containing protein n=1 Tax=Streptomyces meridianus TaxID=2938945 RepID=A0ABT0X2R8_9ACTN|nr:DUF397 domain-containing protein [Streptomyces meridianus]MCM2576832.1 DUF397 domain-containing protein [Streptomyces meridianus]